MRRCRTCAKQTSDVDGRIGSMSWTRRDLLKTSAALGLAVPTAGYPFGLSAQEAAAPKMGGRAVVAMNAATETIDPHFSRSQAARNVQNGRASCRGRGCQYVEILVEADTLKATKQQESHKDTQ